MTTLPARRRRAGGRSFTCPLCGLDYVPGGDDLPEHGCPVAFGGCATRHCPRCGYTMPDEERAAPRASSAGCSAPRREAAARRHASPTCPPGSSDDRRALEGDPALLARLTAQGARARRRRPRGPAACPRYVIEVGETTIALERGVAEAIVLRQS